MAIALHFFLTTLHIPTLEALYESVPPIDPTPAIISGTIIVYAAILVVMVKSMQSSKKADTSISNSISLPLTQKKRAVAEAYETHASPENTRRDFLTLGYRFRQYQRHHDLTLDMMCMLLSASDAPLSHDAYASLSQEIYPLSDQHITRVCGRHGALPERVWAIMADS